MLPVLAAVALIGTLSITAPTSGKWDVTAVQGVAPPAQALDIVLKNGGRTGMVVHLMNAPSWVNAWIKPGHPELGRIHEVWIDPGKTATVHFELGPIPPSLPLGKFVDEIAFLADGSTAKEVGVDCSIILTKSP